MSADKYAHKNQFEQMHRSVDIDSFLVDEKNIQPNSC